MGLMSQEITKDEELIANTPDDFTLSGGLPKADAVNVDQGMYIDWEAGDSLTSASRETGIPVALLQEWNGGSEKVFAGDSLRIPDDFELQDTVEPAPEVGDRAALDAAVIEMRRKEADGLNSTEAAATQAAYYAKDDQDFLAYGGTEEPLVATPRTAMEETEELLTQAPVQSTGTVNTVDDEVTNAVYETIRQVENNRDNKGSGWSNTTQKWLPHSSYEKGTDTIGYGHKFATQEEADAVTASGGITEAQAIELFKEDMSTAEGRAKTHYEKTYAGREWDDLGTLGKLMLTEVTFNTGTLLKADGAYGWTQLTAAIHDRDYEAASGELSRTAPKDGKDVPLIRRTEALKEVYKRVLPKAGWTGINTQASIDLTDWANIIV